MNKDVFKISYKQIIDYIKKYKGFGFLTYPAKDNLERKLGVDNAPVLPNIQKNSEDISTSQTNETSKQNSQLNGLSPTDVKDHPIILTFGPNGGPDFSKYFTKEYQGEGDTKLLISQLENLVKSLQAETRQDVSLIVKAVNRVVDSFRGTLTYVKEATDANTLNLELQKQTLETQNKTILSTFREGINKVMSEMIKQNEFRRDNRTSSFSDAMEIDKTLSPIISSNITPDYIIELTNFIKTLGQKLDNFKAINIADIDTIIQRNNTFVQSSNSVNYNHTIQETLNQINIFFTKVKDDLPKNVDIKSKLNIDTTEVEAALKRVVQDISTVSTELKNYKPPKPDDGGASSAITVDLNYDVFFKKLSEDNRIKEFFQPIVIKPDNILETERVVTVLNRLQTSLDRLGSSDAISTQLLVNIADALKTLTENTQVNLSNIALTQNASADEINSLINTIAISNTHITEIKSLLDKLPKVNALDNETVQIIKNLLNKTSPDTAKQDEYLKNIEQNLSSLRVDRDFVDKVLSQIAATSDESTRILATIINRLEASDEVKKYLLEQLKRKEQPLSIKPDISPISNQLDKIYKFLLNFYNATLVPSQRNLEEIEYFQDPEAIGATDALVNATVVIDELQETNQRLAIEGRQVVIEELQGIEETNQITYDQRLPIEGPVYLDVPPPNNNPPTQNNPASILNSDENTTDANSIQFQINQIKKSNNNSATTDARSRISFFKDTKFKTGFKGRARPTAADYLGKKKTDSELKLKEEETNFQNEIMDEQEKRYKELMSHFRSKKIMKNLAPLLSEFNNKHHKLVEIHKQVVSDLRLLDKAQLESQSKDRVVSGNNNISEGGSLTDYVNSFNGKFNSNLTGMQIRDRLNNQSHILGTILERQIVFLSLVQNNKRANKRVVTEIAARLIATSDNHLFNSDYDRVITSKKCPNCGDLYSDSNKRLEMECEDSICTACFNIFGNVCFINYFHNRQINPAAQPANDIKQTIFVKSAEESNGDQTLATMNNIFTLQEIKVGTKTEKIQKVDYILKACEKIEFVTSQTLSTPKLEENEFNMTNISLLKTLANQKDTQSFMKTILLGFDRNERQDILRSCTHLIASIRRKKSNKFIDTNVFMQHFHRLFGSHNLVPDEINPFQFCLKQKGAPILGNVDDNLLSVYAEGYLVRATQKQYEYRTDPIYNFPLINRIETINDQSGFEMEGNKSIKLPGPNATCGKCTIALKDTWYNIKHGNNQSCNVCENCQLKCQEGKCAQCDRVIIGMERLYTKAVEIRNKGNLNSFPIDDNLSKILTPEERLWLQSEQYKTQFPTLEVPEGYAAATNPFYNEKFSAEIYNTASQFMSLEDVSKDPVNQTREIPLNEPEIGKSQLMLKNNPNNIINNNLTPNVRTVNGIPVQDKKSTPTPSDFTPVVMGYNPMLSNYETESLLKQQKGHINAPAEMGKVIQTPSVINLVQDLEDEYEEPQQDTIKYFMKIVNNYHMTKNDVNQLNYYGRQPGIVPVNDDETSSRAEGINKENSNDEHFKKLKLRFAYVPPSKRFDHIEHISKQDISNHKVIAEGILSNYVKNNNINHHEGDLKFTYKMHTLKKKNINSAPKASIKIPNCDHCNNSLLNKEFYVYKKQDTDPIKGGVICSNCFTTKNMLPNSRKMMDKSAYDLAYESTTNTAKGIIKNIHKKIVEPFHEITQTPKTLWESFKDTIPNKYNVNNVIEKMLKDIILTSEHVSELDLDYYVIALAYNTFTDHSTDTLKANIFSLSNMYAKQRGVEYLKLYRVAFTKFQTFHNLKNYITEYPNIILQLIPHNG
jgi:hypothetical protein